MVQHGFIEDRRRASAAGAVSDRDPPKTPEKRIGARFRAASTHCGAAAGPGGYGSVAASTLHPKSISIRPRSTRPGTTQLSSKSAPI
eukprot:scaffold11431_cov118-Isochrysis_galbana.AAC.9